MASSGPGTRLHRTPQSAQSNLAKALAQHNRARKPTSASPPNPLKETASSPPRQASKVAGPDSSEHNDSHAENGRVGSSDDSSGSFKQQATSPHLTEAKLILSDAHKGMPTERQPHRYRKVLAASPPSRRLLNAQVMASDSHRKQTVRRVAPPIKSSANGSIGETGNSSLQKAAKAAYTPEQRIALIVAKRHAAREDLYQQRKKAYDKYRKEHGLTGDAQDAHSQNLKQQMEETKSLRDIEYKVQQPAGSHKRKASSRGSSTIGGDAPTRVRRSPPSRSASSPMPKLADSAESSTHTSLTEDVARMAVSSRRHKPASSMSALPSHTSTNTKPSEKVENASASKAKRFFGLI